MWTLKMKGYHNQGIAHAAKGKNDLAIQDHSKGIEINAEHADTYSDGRVYSAELGDKEEGCSDCSELETWVDLYRNVAKDYKIQAVLVRLKPDC
jgi:hypothetical protein